MPAETIPGFRFFRTNDTRGADVSAVYAIYGALRPLAPVSGASPLGYAALMWAAGTLSQGELSEQFLLAYTREISASRLYAIALPFYQYLQTEKNRLLLDAAS